MEVLLLSKRFSSLLGSLTIKKFFTIEIRILKKPG